MAGKTYRTKNYLSQSGAGTLCLVLLCLFLHPALHSQVDTTHYYTQMETYRTQAVEQLWQSDRQPITAEDTVYLDFFELNTAYRLPCKMVRTPEAEPFEIATYSGLVREYTPYARLEMEIEGQPFSLEVYRNSETLLEDPQSDYLFLPFKDYTNGATTYGGGRYLNLSISTLAEEGCYVDFNKAYNPWCAYRDGFNCPIPPAANHLRFEVKAGERGFGKGGME